MQSRVSIQTIGVIHSPYTTRENMPIQPPGAGEVEGTVEVFPRFAPGLKDLDGFSHIYLIYRFHLTRQTRLEVVPFLDTVLRGVFATRSPRRPARIGLSIVELMEVDENHLRVKGIDILDGTPLLDIKPYVPAFDDRPGARTGWLTPGRERIRRQRSDDRFS